MELGTLNIFGSQVANVCAGDERSEKLVILLYIYCVNVFLGFFFFLLTPVYELRLSRLCFTQMSLLVPVPEQHNFIYTRYCCWVRSDN